MRLVRLVRCGLAGSRKLDKRPRYDALVSCNFQGRAHCRAHVRRVVRGWGEDFWQNSYCLCECGAVSSGCEEEGLETALAER